MYHPLFSVVSLVIQPRMPSIPLRVRITQKALLWKGLDKFESVFECVDWVNGPILHFISAY